MAGTTTLLRARDYDLAATLSSGQAFRWEPHGPAWEGVVEKRWVRLEQRTNGIRAEAAEAVSDWHWLTHYLQTEVELAQVLASFPDDPPLRAAVAACHGLRLLRQDPWECLASFILSSTKQIVHIRQIVARLCERYGEPVTVPPDHAPAYAFPSPVRLASVSETELRECRMGFRAAYLLAAARAVEEGRFDLESLRQMPPETAKEALLQLPGVGPKIADCVLLFAYGVANAFPVDVWVAKALRQLYFPRRAVSMARMQRFAATHFGPTAGYAQQYLFHFARVRSPRSRGSEGEPDAVSSLES